MMKCALQVVICLHTTNDQWHPPGVSPTNSKFVVNTNSSHKINCATKTNSSPPPRETSLLAAEGLQPCIVLVGWDQQAALPTTILWYVCVQYIGWCMSTRRFESWFTTRRYSVWHGYWYMYRMGHYVYYGSGGVGFRKFTAMRVYRRCPLVLLLKARCKLGRALGTEKWTDEVCSRGKRMSICGKFCVRRAAIWRINDGGEGEGGYMRSKQWDGCVANRSVTVGNRGKLRPRWRISAD